MLRYSKNKEIPRGFKSKITIIVVFIIFVFILGTRVFKVFSNFSSLDFWDKFGFIFVTTYLVVLLISTPLAFFISPRTWCQFCTMGSIEKMLGTLGEKTKIAKNTNKKLNDINCIKCKTCVNNCPKGILEIK